MDLRMLLVLCLVSLVRGSDKMEETETADSHVIHKIPDCAFSNKQYYNITFCLQDDYYPVDTIKHELERNKPLVDRILSDITYQSADNLVDGLTKIEEEGYNYAHYYGNGAHKSYKDDFNGYSYSK